MGNAGLEIGQFLSSEGVVVKMRILAVESAYIDLIFPKNPTFTRAVPHVAIRTCRQRCEDDGFR